MTLQQFAKISQYCNIEHTLNRYSSDTIGCTGVLFGGYHDYARYFISFRFYSNLISYVAYNDVGEICKTLTFWYFKHTLHCYNSVTMGCTGVIIGGYQQQAR